MPEQIFSIDDYLKSRTNVMSIDSYLQSRKNIHNYDAMEQEFSSRQRKAEEEDKDTLADEITSVMEQLGYRFLESYTFNQVKKPVTIQPRNTVAAIAGELGGLGASSWVQERP
jgi:hypothetical protein